MDVIQVPKLDIGLSCRFWLFPVVDTAGSLKDPEQNRLRFFLGHILLKDFNPFDVFSAADISSREVAEIITRKVRDHLQRPCRLHRPLQIDDKNPFLMLKTIVESSDPERAVCITAGPVFLQSFYAALRRMDPNRPEGNDDVAGAAIEIRPECVLEVSVLHTGRYGKRCFVEHQYTVTKRHRHKILTLVLACSGMAIRSSPGDDDSRLTPISRTCLTALEANTTARLRTMAGSVVFLADSDHETRLSVAFLLEETDAAFLPIFVSLQKASKIVRFINSQGAGSRVTLMARELVLKDVARLLLGTDSITAESIASNVILLLHHYVPSCSYDDFDLGTRCIETIALNNKT